MGDSHAFALASAVNLSSSEADVAGYYVAKSACPPLLGIDRVNRMGECVQFNQAVLDFIKVHPEIKNVVITARWAISADGSRYKTESGPTVHLIDWGKNSKEKGTNADLFDIGLKRTVEQIIGLDRKVIIVSSVPEVGYHVPSAYWIAERTGRDLNQIVAPTVAEYQARNEAVLNTLAKLKKNYPEIEIIDPAAILCDKSNCLVMDGSTPLYKDDDHLSTSGAFMIAPLFDPSFTALAER